MSLSVITKKKKQEPDLSNLPEKIHRLANIVRTFLDIKQTRSELISKDGEKMCVIGALGFRAGMTKDQIRNNHDYYFILEKYGITKEEAMVRLHWYDNSFMNSLWRWNDYSQLNFYGIADKLDDFANKLSVKQIDASE